MYFDHTPYTQLFPGPALLNFASFSPHQVWFVMPSYTWDGTFYQSMVDLPRTTPLKKTTVLPEAINCKYFFLLGARLHAYILLPCWNFDWFELALHIPCKQLWVYMCTYLVMSEKPCFLLVIHCLWLLHFSYPLFYNDLWALRKIWYDIDVPFRPEDSIVSYSLHLN